MKLNKEAIKNYFSKFAKPANDYIASNNQIVLEDITSINLINQVDDIAFDNVIQTDMSKNGMINYIVFDASYISDEAKLCYFLINENISVNDFNKLMMNLDTIKKLYLYYKVVKTSSSSIQSAKTQYHDKQLIQENRVDRSQWQLHFNGVLEKAIRLGASDIHITAKGQTAIVMARVHGDLVEIDRYTYSDMLRLISSAYNQLASIDSKDQSYSPSLTHETGIHKITILFKLDRL